MCGDFLLYRQGTAFDQYPVRRGPLEHGVDYIVQCRGIGQRGRGERRPPPATSAADAPARRPAPVSAAMRSGLISKPGDLEAAPEQVARYIPRPSVPARSRLPYGSYSILPIVVGDARSVRPFRREFREAQRSAGFSHTPRATDSVNLLQPAWCGPCRAPCRADYVLVTSTMLQSAARGESMKPGVCTCAAIAHTLIHAPSALAHHSFAGEFDRGNPGELTGVISEVRWRNPHVVYVLSTRLADGSTAEWALQTHNIVTLRELDWDASTLAEGDRVTVSGSLGHGGARKMSLDRVVFADGTVLNPAGGELATAYRLTEITARGRRRLRCPNERLPDRHHRCVGQPLPVPVDRRRSAAETDTLHRRRPQDPRIHQGVAGPQQDLHVGRPAADIRSAAINGNRRRGSLLPVRIRGGQPGPPGLDGRPGRAPRRTAKLHGLFAGALGGATGSSSRRRISCPAGSMAPDCPCRAAPVPASWKPIRSAPTG